MISAGSGIVLHLLGPLGHRVQKSGLVNGHHLQELAIVALRTICCGRVFCGEGYLDLRTFLESRQNLFSHFSGALLSMLVARSQLILSQVILLIPRG